MKKFFKMIGVLIGIPLMLYIILIVSSLIIVGNSSTLTANEAQKIVSLVIYGGSSISEFICIIILFIIYLRSDEGLIKRCSFKKFSPSKLPTILCLILGYSLLEIGCIYLTKGIFKIHHTKTVEFTFLAHQSTLEIIGALILISIFEEIIFRGVIFGTLKRNLNVTVAIILQALVFVIANINMSINLLFSRGNINITYILSMFFLGIILGIIFLYTESLFGNIICHIIFNLLGILTLPITFYFYYSPIVYIVVGIILLVLSLYLYKRNKNLSVSHN